MPKLNEKIFDFAYGAAMRDATLRTAYQVDGDENAKKAARVALLKNDTAKTLVRKYIDAILNEEPVDFYDVAKNVEAAFNDKAFRFGNTQKLINMTSKYLFIVTYNHEDLRARFNVCHCPMDSIIVKKVKRKIKAELKTKPVDPTLKKLTKSGWICAIEAPWSRMKSPEDGYDLFQNLVDYLRKDSSRLEFDYINWIP